MKKFILGIATGILIAIFLFIFFMPRPGPDPEPIDVTVQEPVIEGNISGQATITERPADQDGQNNQNGTYSPDFKVTVPVQGEFATENAEVKVSGETVVERSGDLLLVDTLFYEAEVSVKYKPPPEPPHKNWHVGAYFVTDFDSIRPGGFVQRDFKLFEFWRVEAVAFGRVEMDMDTRVMAGVQVSF